MTVVRRLTALTGSTVLAVAGLATLSATPASAATCYGGAKSYTLADGSYAYPNESPNTSSGWLTTSSRCADINIKPKRDVRVRACFKSSSGTITCNALRDADEGVWTVVASDVLDGTKFRISFTTHGPDSGSYAA